MTLTSDQLTPNQLKKLGQIRSAEEHGALLCGGVGAGKTAIARLLYAEVWASERVWFKAAETWREAADAYHDKSLRLATDMLKDVKAARFCVIDDLGREPAENVNARQLLFDLIDTALDSKTRLIVTTNLTWAELKVRYPDQAWWSRLAMLTRVEFEAAMPDMRVAK